MNDVKFGIMLFVISLLTGLTVEGIKKILNEYKRKYHSNTLAGIVSAILAALVSLGDLILRGESVDSIFIVYTTTLVFLSWLCSMVGYDKVIQTLAQLKRGDK